MSYNDGKQPSYKMRSPWGKNPGASAADVTPGGGSKIIGRPKHPLPNVQAPTAHAGGLFKAPGCVPGKSGL